MSGFAPEGCVRNGAVNGEAKTWAPTCPNHAGPLSKGQVPCCTLSPWKPQVADALAECELFPPSEVLLALCVLLLREEFPSRPPAGDGLGMCADGQPATPAKTGLS